MRALEKATEKKQVDPGLANLVYEVQELEADVAHLRATVRSVTEHTGDMVRDALDSFSNSDDTATP